MVLRGWVYIASAALLVGMFPSGPISGFSLFAHWWPEEDNGLVGKVSLALALVSAVTASVPRPAPRGAILTVASLAALALYVTAAFSISYGEAVLVAAQITVGSALVTASNHALRRHLELRLARLLSALGGTGILLAFLVEGQRLARPLVYDLAWRGVFRGQWAAPLFSALLLVFGILGVTNALARAPASMRRKGISVFGYALLFLFPLALGIQATTPIREWDWNPPPDPKEMSFLFRLWMLGTGHAVLLAAGLVTWLDALAGPSDPPSGEPASLQRHDIMKPGDSRSL